MHGGLKVYTGAPAAARCYLEADRGRADDYYLADGTGIARRFTAAGGRATELAPLTGDTYEGWVAGRDPDTGDRRGRLRHDEHAVKFVEVVVNGPKTWSLAAALHPDIAKAYDAAQDRAAEQIIAWLSQHTTTRVGPRGGQVQVPVEVLEAATVRHYTSRANDPHRHLHLQLLARVFAVGKWRGLHTVGVRDVINALNGIGHAAMACDPELNSAFAANGYTKNTTGELLQLAEYVGPMSSRARQIERNMDRYERDWLTANPGAHAGPALRRAWHSRAWAEGRPDKAAPAPGIDLDERWRAELHGLGFRAPGGAVPLTRTAVGALDREQLAQRALTRLAAGRSAWNAADVRGEAERLIASAGVVIEAGVRIELAEDVTARAMAACRPLLDRDGVPEHIRAWTSAPVLAVEAELTARLAARAGIGVPDFGLIPSMGLASATARLDSGQTAAVSTLSGEAQLVVVEGAAGAGKTATLVATKAVLEEQGRRLVVVTPTLKAARVAATETGAAAGSAAWLAYQHGWRWDGDGRWTRLVVGEVDPVTGREYAGPAEQAQLLPGDLLVVDEAGMAEQATTLALLTIADERRVRVALLGDRHQLPAVGRGGVLDLAIGQVDADAYLTLDGVHRFVRSDSAGRRVPDIEYAELTLAMRAGTRPEAVFDALLARGHIRLHPHSAALREELTATAAAGYCRGERMAVVGDTRELAAELNAAIRERLVLDGRVDDTAAVTTGSGQRIGVGDRVATRRNDRELDVANRDTWIVAGVGRGGGLVVSPADMVRGNVHGDVTPFCADPRVLPATYVTAHVELSYATTAHGAQGDTVTTAHLVIGEHTGAASAYVGMTRGRQANISHLVAADVDEARELWTAVFARDRADLGPAHAAGLAAAEAARYAPSRPVEQVAADLHRVWTVEQDCLDRLAFLQPQRDQLRQVVELDAPHAGELAKLQAALERTASAVQQARQRLEANAAAIRTDADSIRDELLRSWDDERDTARATARAVLDGPGRFGLRRGGVAHAAEQLADWADRWRRHCDPLPAQPRDRAHERGQLVR